jgi:hypothetical protein
MGSLLDFMNNSLLMAHEMAGVPGAHQFFAGRHHANGDRTRGSGNDRGVSLVAGE